MKVSHFHIMAGEVYRSFNRREGKTKQYNVKIASKSLFKYDILTNLKQAIVYEINDAVFIDLTKINDDGTISPKNRSTLNLDSLFALRSLIPVIQTELQVGKTSCHLLDRSTDLYLSTSRLPKAKPSGYKGGTELMLLTNLRHRYERPDGSMTDGVSSNIYSFFPKQIRLQSIFSFLKMILKIFQGTGVTFTLLELESFRKLIPELLAVALKFGMKPNTYYEEMEYRVFYHADSKAFINIDMMVKFEAGDIPPGESQRVSFIFEESNFVLFYLFYILEQGIKFSTQLLNFFFF